MNDNWDRMTLLAMRVHRLEVTHYRQWVLCVVAVVFVIGDVLLRFL